MKLYERYGERGYHTSIATSFGIDFDAYENIVLPRLRGAGCHNNMLVVDAGMLTEALDTASVLPRHAGRSYTASGATAAGVYHPKLFLQLGRRGGRMIVSSANITASGLAGNLELAGEMVCDMESSGEQRLIARAWDYALRHCDRSGEALADQIAWGESRAPWLRRAAPAMDVVVLADETTAALLTTGGQTGIGEQFLAQIDDAPVKRLIVVSPYWDDDLKALGFLMNRLSPEKIDLLIDPAARLFPANALSRLKGVRLFKRDEFRKGRFLHAKAIIAQTRKSDHVLYGSANCTIAALGTRGYAGANEEVCLYRRFPAGSVLDALEMAGLFDKRRQVDPGTLEANETKDDLDLEAWIKRTPGRFECRFETLIWTPPAGLDSNAVAIELLNTEGQELTCRLTPMRGGRADSWRFQLTGLSERPSFARLRYPDETCSAPAIVTLIDKIRESVREARTRSAENAASQLAEETEEGLWLLDIVNMLEEAERPQNTGDEPISITSRRIKNDGEDDPAQFPKLTYEAFIAGRRPRPKESSVARNSLAGSQLSLVRGFLNRLLNLRGNEEIAEIEDEQTLKKAFDLGDETANAEQEMDSGESFDADAGEKSPEEKQREERRRKAAQRKATREQVVEAVADFNSRISERKVAKSLTTFDILRLRALLTIVASAGWAGDDQESAKEPARTRLQVLPVESRGDSWPRVLGRVLFGFFGGADPAIRHVEIDALHDQLADDILESWATCFWCVQACLAARCSKGERATLAKFIVPLAEKVYRLTGLTRDELLADNITTVMGRMSERFAARLSIDGTGLKKAHNSLARDLYEEVNVS